MEVWPLDSSSGANVGSAGRDYPYDESLGFLADDGKRSRFAIGHIERNVWYGLGVEDIREVDQSHATITREHFQTEQGRFRRQPNNSGWTAIPARREVVKVEVRYVSLNGDAIQPSMSGPAEQNREPWGSAGQR